MNVLQVIEWRDEMGTELVHRWPEEGPGNVSLGAQLTVRESQAAVFFRDGQSLDVLGTGRHTLTTLNIPLLQAIVNLPFGGTTPFQAEVYFVNMRVLTGQKWGTMNPIMFRDKELDFIRLGAYGAYTMRVSDPQLFVNMVVGTEHRYSNDEVNFWMRDFIVARFNDVLGETIDTIIDLAGKYDEVSAAMKARLGEDFSRYGIELIDFLIDSVTPPEEVQQMLDQRAAMRGVGDMRTFLQFQTAKAIGKMPDAGGDGAGGTAAAGAGLGAGLGAGMAMAGAMMESMRDAMHPEQPGGAAPAAGAPAGTTPPAPGAAPAGAQATCPACQAAMPAGSKFCPSCGANLQGAACPECSAEVPAGAKFCPSCGKQIGQ